ncbi:MAG: hypothetical protein M3396_09140 [Actinomycetota bacterium]|nr:hypothetical protein [Actinomycetota bacterium]MDQ3575822.1 hypothetical protein [Actinomycetota bacterium]
MTRVAAYVPDLMDRSKVAAAGDVTFVTTPADLAATPADLVVLDLSRPGVLEALTDLGGARTVGFASHVDHELLAAAAAAGCDEVLPRSRFFARLGELLA